VNYDKTTDSSYMMMRSTWKPFFPKVSNK